MTPRLGSAVLALAIGLGSPAWAAKVYVPYAINQEDRGAFQRTELLLSNGQPSLQQKVSYRLLTDDSASVGGAAKVVSLAGGKSLKVDAPVAPGGRGLLEVDAPAGVSVSARLVVTRPGADPVSTSVPVLDARAAFVDGAQARLQGLAHVEGVRKTSLGVVNLGNKKATCEISVADAEGNEAVRGSVKFALAPRVQGYQENLFNLFGAEAPALAVATVSCSQKFWAYGVVTDDATGDAQFVTPSVDSMVEMAASPEAITTFQLPGTYLTCTKFNHNWQYNMNFPASLPFHIVKVDFDFFHGGWEPGAASDTHCIMWLNKGQYWSDMFAYINALGGSKNLNRFKVNYGGVDIYGNNSPSVQPGQNYHLKYEYNTITHKTWYEIRSTAGNLITTRSFSRTGNTFSTNFHRIQFGTQNGHGPEARTYNWRFSNFVAQFVP